MRASDKAWLVMAAAILVYEILAPPGELLTNGVGRHLAAHPWITRGVVLVVAAHLLGVLPRWCDPLRLIGGVRCWIRLIR